MYTQAKVPQAPPAPGQRRKPANGGILSDDQRYGLAGSCVVSNPKFHSSCRAMHSVCLQCRAYGPPTRQDLMV